MITITLIIIMTEEWSISPFDPPFFKHSAFVVFHTVNIRKRFGIFVNKKIELCNLKRKLYPDLILYMYIHKDNVEPYDEISIKMTVLSCNIQILLIVYACLWGPYCWLFMV